MARTLKIVLAELPMLTQTIRAGNYQPRADRMDELPEHFQRLGFAAHAAKGDEIVIEAAELIALGFSEQRLPPGVKVVEVLS